MTTLHLKSHRSGTYSYRSKEATHVALRAIIFDCDGVLMDSEPLHFAALKKTLGSQADGLTEETYKERYLTLDDRDSIATFYRDHRLMLSNDEMQRLVEKKTTVFQELLTTEGVLPFPAVPEFIMALSQRYPLAVASGSRRHELEMLLESAGIRPYFEEIISADDVTKGKPDPESYLKAIEALNASGRRPTAIQPNECVVIEDSRDAITSAHAAGMKCIGVATSYPAFMLSGADLVVPSLSALKISQVEDLFHPPMPQPAPQSQNN